MTHPIGGLESRRINCLESRKLTIVTSETLLYVYSSRKLQVQNKIIQTCFKSTILNEVLLGYGIR